MMKYSILRTGQFKKDYKMAKKRGKDLKILLTVVGNLANGIKLEKKYKDHQLSGNYSSYRECHLEPDWLLVYKIINKRIVIGINTYWLA